jgi:hypothetical protein
MAEQSRAMVGAASVTVRSTPSIIAWRIQMLVRLGRTCPEMDCEVFFEREEWQAAYLVARKPIPKEPPPLNAVIRIVASFGGFLGRGSCQQTCRVSSSSFL